MALLLSFAKGGVSITARSQPASRTALRTWRRRAAGTAVMASVASTLVGWLLVRFGSLPGATSFTLVGRVPAGGSGFPASRMRAAQ